MAPNPAPAQSFISSYAPRLRQYANAFVTPVLQTQAVAPGSRTTKRGTTIINYADDAFDDDDFEESDGPRRPTGLRSLRREETAAREGGPEKLGKEIFSPVETQGIFRDWMVRRTVKPTTDQQVNIQAQLPLTLIPIRIDLDVNAFQPDAPFPLPRNANDPTVNPSLPAFRRPDPAPPYKIRDTFLWNLHEALLTPDDFAQTMVRELDLPNQHSLATAISSQIRSQLEEYAGIALHPLFHSSSKTQGQKQDVSTPGAALGPAGSRALHLGASPAGTPRPAFDTFRSSRNPSMTPGASTPMPSTPQAQTNGNSTPGPVVQAEAELIAPNEASPDGFLNPDDTYRCIITLSISLSSRLYTDKFEWSLLHPPGLAETFAKQTCADMGLGGEWVMAITHAIYEAVLKLKKEACEGGLLSTGGSWGMGGEIDNQAMNPESQSGWRYDAEDFAAEWEPKLEALSKDEIEKREGDRERQLRRLRRETARFSSNTGMASFAAPEPRGSYFDTPAEDTPMGRGERSKKKRRFRSLSPVAKALGTPDGSAPAGWGAGGSGVLNEHERQVFRCRWCQVWGSAVWAVRDGPGPDGARSLCQNCGLLYERDKKLPVWSKDLHRHDMQVR